MTVNIKNPVEQQTAEIDQLWQDAIQDTHARLFVWRTPEESDRLLYGFLALQQQPNNPYSSPDLMINIQASYQTSYQFCQAIAQELIDRYQATEINGPRWEYTHLVPCYRIDQLNALLTSFVEHHNQQLRYLTLVLMPEHIGHVNSFLQWLSDGLATPLAERIRLIAVDSFEQPHLQPLLDNDPAQSVLIELKIDELQLARQLLNATPSSDSGDMLRFRQLMADTFIELSQGNTAQLVNRAQQAIDIAKKQSWFDQLVTVQNMLAGSYLKDNNTAEAITHYQHAQQSAIQIADITQQRTLQTQSLFGEAGAWFVAKDYLTASKTYLAAAQLAEQIPQPLWVIDGYRMAAVCLLQTKKRTGLDEAANYFHQALLAGAKLSHEQRSQSTFMFIFQDIMRFADRSRVEKLTQLASTYQTSQAQLITDVEQTVRALPVPVSTETIAQHDALLDQKMVELFNEIIQERETLVAQSHIVFKSLISIARYYLDPYWSVQQQIAHPLDEPQQQWLQPDNYTPAIAESSTEYPTVPDAFYSLVHTIFSSNQQQEQHV